MNINFHPGCQEEFRLLVGGDVFRHNGKFYMKINNPQNTAVELSDGDLTQISEFATVEIFDAELIIH